MSYLKLLTIACLCATICGPLAGCSKAKEDPTKLPGYKDMTNTANMPAMGPSLSGPSGTTP